ncbi:MAG: hypothetical protein QOJ40_1840 [Verrucomicrobiota bacterium]|jgi:hypothetical protein
MKLEFSNLMASAFFVFVAIWTSLGAVILWIDKKVPRFLGALLLALLFWGFAVHSLLRSQPINLTEGLIALLALCGLAFQLVKTLKR